MPSSDHRTVIKILIHAHLFPDAAGITNKGIVDFRMVFSATDPIIKRDIPVRP
jgi:hypothetical protein